MIRQLTLIVFSVISCLVFCHSSVATTFKKGEIICPIDGEKFSFTQITSETVDFIMLDAQPLIPWPLPVCPTTKFVIYRDDFTPDEITKIRKFVSSPAWSALKGESPFYRAAETMQWMGEDSENTAYMFLNATRKTTSREQSRRYDSKALEHFRNLLQSRNVETENREPNSLEAEAISSWITLELITGELERRLGMFREAKGRFERLAKLPAFQGNYRAKVVTLQLQLVAEGRSNPHFAP